DRAMFITIIGRLVGAESSAPSPFKDTEPNTWYSPYVAWAADLGVVNGFPDGTFRPYEAITREQMATATDRFLNATGLNAIAGGGIFNFADEAKVSDWAKKSVGNLKKIGIFTGDTAGRFNPESNTTRAEAATVVTRLKKAIDAAWQGYTPSAGAGRLVFGAKYLFENGSVLAGGMKRGLDESGEYPLLTLEMNGTTAFATYLSANTTGISVSLAEFFPEEYPVVKICYSFDGMDETVPTAFYRTNNTQTARGFTEYLTLAPGADEDGMRTATADLTATFSTHTVDRTTQIENLIFSPCPGDYKGDGKFVVKYIGFFKTQADADAFGAAADPDISDYLKNYALGFAADVREYTAEDKAYYDKLLADRIAEIKNSPSELTPEMIEANGGKCYYLSSIHGDDSNDGLSPETPWRSVSKLWRVIGETDISIPKKGDGVFFERGSVYYPELYHKNIMSNLALASNVSYGAYGEGPKPMFTGALDFTDSDGVGDWEPTGYPNIWKIACVDDTVTEYEDDDGTEVTAVWYGVRSEICNMVFDGGRAVGIRVSAKGDLQTFGDGIVSNEKGQCFNGFEYFYCESRSLENPGTALLHNLEFFHDWETGALYLYWDKGDPADSFDDIKAGRNAVCVYGANDVFVDNLAFVYSGRGVGSGGRNVTFKNCEFGCTGGSVDSAESAFEVNGRSDGVYMFNNYVHDVFDGAMSSQSTNINPENPVIINNVNYIDNVMVSCGHSAEIWNHVHDLDENGISASKITNCTLKGNIMAYDGYTWHVKQDTQAFSTGVTICSDIYGELSNCRVEDNIFLYGMGAIYCAYMATYRQPRGWESLGNVYVADPDFYFIGTSYETLNYISHRMMNRDIVHFPYTTEGLSWYASLGIDPKGVYYTYDSGNPYKELNGNGCFFMTGYYAERGIDPT
ncbi:MAG: S-layer homology domain-containing protein, partial [Clostridia bacterium]|nr:S-layer homology domain-containing protein [Clostridia bacterium]